MLAFYCARLAEGCQMNDFSLLTTGSCATLGVFRSYYDCEAADCTSVQFIYWCINTLQQLSDTLPSKYLNYILFSTEQCINWLVDVLGWLKKRLITSTDIKIITFHYFIVNYCEMCQLGYLKIIWLWSRWLYACLFEKSTALSVPLRYLFMTLSIPCNTVRWINYLQPH